MGFYFRKSKSLGGLKFNFSKSGIGLSFGVKGMRYVMSPKGNYIHMGRNAFYYRTSVGGKSRRSGNTSNSNPVEVMPDPDYAYREAIDSGDVRNIVDADSQVIVDEISKNRKKWSTWPLALGLLFISHVGILMAIIGIVLLRTIVDRRRKTTYITYEIDPELEGKMQAFYDAFNELKSCTATWLIESSADNSDSRSIAVVETKVQRTRIAISYKQPSYVRTNVKVPSIPVGKQTIYFYPDRMLIFEGRRVGGLTYAHFTVEQEDSPFVESQLPRDATVLTRTWTYTTKDGSPDRRYRDNPALDVANYSTLTFKSDTGLYEKVMFSKQGAGLAWIEQLGEFKSNIESLPNQPEAEVR
jgi:hypothetical protein